MNDVVNVLVEHGEVDPGAEVTIVVLIVVIVIVFVVEYT